MTHLLYKYTSRFASRWFILFMDMSIVAISFLVSTLIYYNFDFNTDIFHTYLRHLPIILLIKGLFFLVFQTQKGIIRHTSSEDTQLLFQAVSTSSGILLLLTLFSSSIQNGLLNIPLSIVIIDYFILLVILTMMRMVIKIAYRYLLRRHKSSYQKVIIYGAGQLGIMAKNTLQRDNKKVVDILCFIDDNPKMVGKTVEGIKVTSRKRAIDLYLSRPIRKGNVDVVFAINTIDNKKKNEIIEEFIKQDVHLKIIPPADRWINGELSTNQIKNIRIEDLLGREPIKLNNQNIHDHIRGKRICITGAAGSIGSEIVRLLLCYRPSTVILIDQAESSLYDLETEIKRLSIPQETHTQIILVVGNVIDESHMNHVFTLHKPELVFHAAANKHVPLMENNPYKAFEVNVIGTQVIAELSSAHQVEKFVLISTDKAVNPTNVMGATKRMAEIYIQSLNADSMNQTKFIVTRFGNVLGSNGSVIPLFKKQIEHGGPVTITHPDIIRYFMTIPEACQLVLEAGIMGQGGEIFVFDMGEPVKIVDLAIKMIQLSGLTPHQDIKITYTGLREGEKLFEELLGSSEHEVATHHPKIKIAKIPTYEFKDIKKEMESFRRTDHQEHPMETVSFLKRLIPEYISNNSIFEILDN